MSSNPLLSSSQTVLCLFIVYSTQTHFVLLCIMQVFCHGLMIPMSQLLSATGDVGSVNSLVYQSVLNKTSFLSTTGYRILTWTGCCISICRLSMF